MDTELTLLPLCDRVVRHRVQHELSSSRDRFLGRLYHVPPFDERYVTVLPASALSDARQTVRAELRARGAPDECYVISNHSPHDGTTIPLDDAINEVVAHGDGTILLCIPGRLAYYEGEYANDAWIVERKS